MKKNRYTMISLLTWVWKRKIVFIMRLSFSILLLCVLQSFAVSTFSQNQRLSISQKHISVESLMQIIEDKTDYYFMYSALNVDVKRVVDVEATNKLVPEILDDVFQGTEISYKVNGRIIALSKIGDGFAFAQQPSSVTGRVTDFSGEPLPGVAVLVKGTTKGTITDFDGNYTISNVPPAGTLVFSFVGMRSQEIGIGNQSTIDVVMEEDAIGIEEVVAVGYGTQKKVSITGSVASISDEDLTLTPSTNTTSMISGRLPGLIVHQTNGRPGADAARVTIRGFGNALVLVDGVQRDFTQLDPNEIESVNILKDASATVYGARAGNGVILVTTKRGKAGAPTISLNTSLSMSQPTYFPDYVNAYQFASMLTQAEGGVGPGSTFSQEDLNKYEAGTEPGYVGTDWQNELMRDWAPQQQHNLNVTGGNEVAKYRINLGHLNQGSLWRSGDGIFQRFNVSSNVDINISERFASQLDINWRRESRDDPGEFGNIFRDLFFASPTVDISYFRDSELIPVSSPTRPTENQPVALANQDISGYVRDKRDILNGAFSLKYEIPIEGFSVDGKVALRTINRINNNFANTFEVWEYDYENDLLSSGGLIGSNSIRKQSYRAQRITTQLALRYEKTFNKHEITGLLLNERIFEESDNYWASRNEVLSKFLPYLFAGNAETQLNGDDISEDGRESFVGRVNYGFNGKYLAEFSFRYDGSPRFPEDKRWGFFPGVSVGWRISEEPFMGNGFVDNLKVRASISQTGFDGISSYDYLTGYQLTGGANNFTILGNQTLSQLRTIGLANPNITWETIDLYNLGIDGSVLKGLFGFEFDIFYRKRGGMLARRNETISNTFGASLPAENINSQDNRGFEFALHHRKNFNDLKYNISANISWTRAKWIHREERTNFEDADDERINKLSGQWTNRTFGYLTDGFFNSQEEIDNETVDQDQGGNVSIEPGDIRYVDFNGDGVITERDQVVIGKGIAPELMFAVNASASYKGFDFTMLWQGAGGFVTVFRDDNNIGGLRVGAGVPLTYQWKYQWNPENPENAKLPAPNLVGVKSHNLKLNDMYVKDATYLRLKNIALGYSIPSSIIQKAGIRKVRIYLSAVNLLTFMDLGIFNNYDPEISGGNPQETYPIQKVFSLGANITL